ncbi:TPA: glycosyltransferase family 4 protein, partial [Escherichia coli]|nr:glycosyltransferase [Escherichia coli]HDW1490938.1 glycosyltransferase family 4 protein [Escherichia coli]
GFSGASLQAKNLAKALKKHAPNIEQIFVTRCQNRISKLSEDVQFSVMEISSSYKRFWQFFLLCKSIKPDVVHFHGADFGLLGICAIFKIPVYWKSTLLDCDDFHTLINRGSLRSLKHWLLRFISINNTLSKQIYEINSKYIPITRLVTIPNGVSAPDCMYGNEQIKEKIVLIISAIIPRKKIIEGIKFYKDNFENQGYKLLIIGPDNESLDGFEAGYVLNCKQFSSNNIHFLGKIEHQKINEIMCRSQFLIHLSEREGMPNVVLEALANGVYPIIGEMGGLAYEMINNGSCGFICNNKDKFDINKYMGVNITGIDMVNEKYSFDVISEKTFNIYMKLIGEK